MSKNSENVAINARIVMGANYGDEGKGTVVATYAANAKGKVLNVLTNGGSQRSHSIMTEDGNFTFQHFGSGTIFSADNYYSKDFIINPMQFCREYDELSRRMIPYESNIYVDSVCRFSTIFDMIANQIQQERLGVHGSCGYGIWTTIQRYNDGEGINWLKFILMPSEERKTHVIGVMKYYERKLGEIPENWKSLWNETVIDNYLRDVLIMSAATNICHSIPLTYCKGKFSLRYSDIIFENGQGLLLCDNGNDIPNTTPSKTDSTIAMLIINDLRSRGDFDLNVTKHYVTRTYLTRHGDGELEGEVAREELSSNILEERTNKTNPFQGKFRYAKLDIEGLRDRIDEENKTNSDFIVEVTHCDEIDNTDEFRAVFGEKINTYNSPYINVAKL